MPELTRGKFCEPGVEEDDVGNGVAEEGRHLEDLAHGDGLNIFRYPLTETPLGSLNQS